MGLGVGSVVKVDVDGIFDVELVDVLKITGFEGEGVEDGATGTVVPKWLKVGGPFAEGVADVGGLLPLMEEKINWDELPEAGVVVTELELFDPPPKTNDGQQTLASVPS